jgi:hypothetical protein
VDHEFYGRFVAERRRATQRSGRSRRVRRPSFANRPQTHGSAPLPMCVGITSSGADREGDDLSATAPLRHPGPRGPGLSPPSSWMSSPTFQLGRPSANEGRGADYKSITRPGCRSPLWRNSLQMQLSALSWPINHRRKQRIHRAPRQRALSPRAKILRQRKDGCCRANYLSSEVAVWSRIARRLLQDAVYRHNSCFAQRSSPGRFRRRESRSCLTAWSDRCFA